MRRRLFVLAVLIPIVLSLTGPAGLASPADQQAPEPYPFSDRYPAQVILADAAMKEALIGAGVDVGDIQPLQPPQPFPLAATVYVNDAEVRQLAQLGLTATPIPNEGLRAHLAYGPGSGGPDAWPTYEEFVARMQGLADNHPDLVRMFSIGQSVLGRDMWVLKITDHPDLEEDEPEFRYFANMHGDETTGIEMTIRLAELLVNSYGTAPTLTNLVDEMEIWLLPIYNPDGYVAGSRYNANGEDLNRDMPDRFTDPVDDPAGQQPENQRVMAFGYPRRFAMGANYHGGAAVVNYPWDAVAAPGQPIVPVYAPDDAIFYEYAVGYAIRNPTIWNGGFPNGVTRGWEWYQIYGGLQDYAYYWHDEQHVTIEIGTKKPAYSQMDAYWQNNRAAMLWWMERTLRGARGLVTDACSGAPLDAAVDVLEIGKAVHTDPDVGDYHRMLLPGTYTLIASAAGYPSMTATVTVVDGPATVQHFALGESSPYTVQGAVTEAGSGRPLAATVEVLETGAITQTDPLDGHYALHLCPGNYTLRASAPYHRTEERQVTVSGDMVEDFALEPYDYSVSVGSSKRAGAPGETVTHTLALTNSGSASDTYRLALVTGDWPAALLQDEIGPLAPGETAMAEVVVQVPIGLPGSTTLFSDTFTLYVTSTAVPEVGDQGTGTTYAVAELGLALAAEQDHLSGPAGQPLTYTLRLTNTGNYTDGYTLAAQGNAWPTAVIPPAVPALGPGEAALVLVRVDIPTSPAAPTDTVTVQATSGWDEALYARQTLRSQVLGAAVVAGSSLVAGAPGETVTHTLVITNAGSVADAYDLGVGGYRWPTVLLTPQVGPLEPGERAEAYVAVRIPYAALTETALFSDVFSLRVTSTVVPSVTAGAAGTTLAVVDLAVALAADRPAGLGWPGDVVAYTLTVSNAGAYTDSYTLALLPGADWPATISPTQTPALGPGASATAWVRVVVPPGAGGAADAVTVRVQSGWSSIIRAEQSLTTRRGWRLFLSLVAK